MGTGSYWLNVLHGDHYNGILYTCNRNHCNSYAAAEFIWIFTRATSQEAQAVLDQAMILKALAELDRAPNQEAQAALDRATSVDINMSM